MLIPKAEHDLKKQINLLKNYKSNNEINDSKIHGMGNELEVLVTAFFNQSSKHQEAQFEQLQQACAEVIHKYDKQIKNDTQWNQTKPLLPDLFVGQQSRMDYWKSSLQKIFAQKKSDSPGAPQPGNTPKSF